jgi:hypothetical protein
MHRTARQMGGADNPPRPGARQEFADPGSMIGAGVCGLCFYESQIWSSDTWPAGQPVFAVMFSLK